MSYDRIEPDHDKEIRLEEAAAATATSRSKLFHHLSSALSGCPALHLQRKGRAGDGIDLLQETSYVKYCMKANHIKIELR